MNFCEYIHKNIHLPTPLWISFLHSYNSYIGFFWPKTAGESLHL